MEKLEQIKTIEQLCPMYKNGTSKRLLRHEFFREIKTEIQAYLLGFHAADGSINNERSTLRIKVTKTDSEIINLFQEFISPNAHIRDVNGFKSTIREKEVTTKTANEISIASKILTTDLSNFGFGQNKTYNELHIPNISEDLIRHFLRGYFDGDGSFIGSIRKPNPNNREKNYRVSRAFNIDSKTKSILEDIQKYLEKQGIKVNINYITRDDMYRLVTSSESEIKKLFNLLYDDSNFYLKRKFNKFNYYVNTEVSQIITDHCNAQVLSAKRAIMYPRVRDILI